MKIWLFTLLFALASPWLYAQRGNKLPKKTRGVYLGVQPSYTCTIGGSPLTFPAVALEIIIAKYTVTLCYKDPLYCPIQEEKVEKWETVKTMGDICYQLWVKEKGAMLSDEWTLNSKRKTLIRKGIFPQPTTELTRLRKK